MRLHVTVDGSVGIKHYKLAGFDHDEAEELVRELYPGEPTTVWIID